MKIQFGFCFSLTLSRKTGLFDQRDKPKYVTCLAFSFTGDVITGDSNGNVFIWGRGYNAVTKALRKVHDGPIFAICVLKDGSVVTGGGKDRRLVQFDASYRKSGLEAEVTCCFLRLLLLANLRDSSLLS
jgi:microtubule-associated protein-like 1/2